MESTGQQWLVFLLGAAALHGCWLALVLFLKNRNNSKAWLLGAAFVFVSLHLFNYLLYLTKAIYQFPHAVGAFYPIMFLIGPAFYFYVKNNLQPDFQFKKIHLLHLTPVLLAALMMMRLYAATVEYKIKVINWFLHPDDSFTWLSMISGNDYNYHIMAYFGAAWWLAYKIELTEQNSPSKKSYARWFRHFSLLFFLFMLLQLIIKFSAFALSIPAFTMEYILAAVMAIGIHIAGYYAIGQMKIHPTPADLKSLQNGEKGENGKYKTSPLTEAQIATYKSELLDLMEKEKPYLIAALKISDLAKMLKLPSHHLSQVLNEGMQTSYYDLINGYRIELAKKKLKEEKYRHYSILAIGMECGFANKTTFNRTFKKITGMTPSEYIGANSEIK